MAIIMRLLGMAPVLKRNEVPFLVKYLIFQNSEALVSLSAVPKLKGQHSLRN